MIIYQPFACDNAVNIGGWRIARPQIVIIDVGIIVYVSITIIIIITEFQYWYLNSIINIKDSLSDHIGSIAHQFLQKLYLI